MAVQTPRISNHILNSDWPIQTFIMAAYDILEFAIV
jgi:hypothetical protein